MLNRTRPVLGVIMLLALSWPSSLSAQDLAPMRIGWAPFEPYYSVDQTGAPRGFVPDFAAELAAEAGFEVEYVKYPNIRDTFQAVRDGEVDLLPFLPLLQLLTDDTLISDAIVENEVVLVTRAGERIETPDSVTGLRIAVVRDSPGESTEIVQRNEPVPVDGVDAAIFSVLSGKADALVGSGDLVFASARRARVDARLSFSDHAMMSTSRHAIISTARAETLGLMGLATLGMATRRRVA